MEETKEAVHGGFSGEVDEVLQIGSKGEVWSLGGSLIEDSMFSLVINTTIYEQAIAVIYLSSSIHSIINELTALFKKNVFIYSLIGR